MLGDPPAQAGVHLTRGQQLLEVVDPLEARPLAVLEAQPGVSIRAIQLFGALSSGPLRLEVGQEPLDLTEVHAIAARIRAAARRVLDARARHDVADDFGEI